MGKYEYEILEHTADLKVKVFGRTKKELFANAMRAMFESADYESVSGPNASNRAGAAKEREIKISSPNLSSLLIDFLSELLYLCETNKEVYHDIIFKKLSDTKIEATLSAKKLKRIGAQIKGVTYHDLEIKQKNGLWQAIVLFDI